MRSPITFLTYNSPVGVPGRKAVPRTTCLSLLNEPTPEEQRKMDEMVLQQNDRFGINKEQVLQLERYETSLQSQSSSWSPPAAQFSPVYSPRNVAGPTWQYAGQYVGGPAYNVSPHSSASPRTSDHYAPHASYTPVSAQGQVYGSWECMSKV
jgi:hypothetical protein